MCTQCGPNLPETGGQEQEGAFLERLIGVMDGAATALMISVGHRTGLFDALRTLPPSTCAELAEAARLNERYVREWLGAMSCAKIVNYDPSTKKFSLPQAHARFLTRAFSRDNVATLTQYVSVLGSVEDKIVSCFERGGGVPYSEFNRFHEVMAEDSGQSTISSLLEHILPLVPRLSEKLEQGIDVLDVGCGRGRALLLMAEAFPESRFTGYDLSPEAITWAQEQAKKRNLSNVRFEIQDAAQMRDSAAFDLITTFDAIHDQAKPAVVLKKIYDALRPGGVYLMQDIDGRSELGDNLDRILGTFLYTVSCMHCMTVSLAQGGEGLGTMWGVELAQQMLKEAGFGSTRIERLEHDIQNCYYINLKE